MPKKRAGAAGRAPRSARAPLLHKANAAATCTALWTMSSLTADEGGGFLSNVSTPSLISLAARRPRHTERNARTPSSAGLRRLRHLRRLPRHRVAARGARRRPAGEGGGGREGARRRRPSRGRREETTGTAPQAAARLHARATPRVRRPRRRHAGLRGAPRRRLRRVRRAPLLRARRRLRDVPRPRREPVPREDVARGVRPRRPRRRPQLRRARPAQRLVRAFFPCLFA